MIHAQQLIVDDYDFRVNVDRLAADRDRIKGTEAAERIRAPEHSQQRYARSIHRLLLEPAFGALRKDRTISGPSGSRSLFASASASRRDARYWLSR